MTTTTVSQSISGSTPPASGRSAPVCRILLWLPGVCYLSEFFLLVLFHGNRALNPLLGTLWGLGQLGVVSCLVQIHHRRLNGDGRWRLLAVLVAALGCLAYLANLFLVAGGISVPRLLPLGALLSACGLTAVGWGVWRARRLVGWRRGTVLIAGLYPLVVMLGLLLLRGHPDPYAIMLWGVPWLAVAASLKSVMPAPSAI